MANKRVNIVFTAAQERIMNMIIDKYDRAGLPTRGLQAKVINDGLDASLKRYNEIADKHLKTVQ